MPMTHVVWKPPRQSLPVPVFRCLGLHILVVDVSKVSCRSSREYQEVAKFSEVFSICGLSFGSYIYSLQTNWYSKTMFTGQLFCMKINVVFCKILKTREVRQNFRKVTMKVILGNQLPQKILQRIRVLTWAEMFLSSGLRKLNSTTEKN